MKLILNLIIFFFLFIGCSQPPIKTNEIYSIAYRQLPLEDIYYPIRDVLPPHPIPESSNNNDYSDFESQKSETSIDSVYEFKVKKDTLTDISYILAHIIKFEGSCNSQKCNDKYSLQMTGTFDEIKNKIEQIAEVKILLDQKNRKLKITEKEIITAEF